MLRIRISPDGKEVMHLYHEEYNKITSKHADVRIDRATNVFFDNDVKRWRVAFLDSDTVSEESFESRREALEFETKVLQVALRCKVV